jgi:adenylate cyclase
MGIGLNSGPVSSGNVGSEERLEYAAVGDTTNVAARLEAKSKETPHALLFSDATRALLDGEPPDLVEVGEVELRGREARIRVWSLELQGVGGGAPTLPP